MRKSQSEILCFTPAKIRKFSNYFDMPRANKISADCKALPIDSSFLDVSFDWFQDQEFSSLMMAPKITRDSHREWFESLPYRQDYKIWGVAYCDSWVGACGIKNIDLAKKTGEYWGYIGHVGFRRKGIGSWMLGHIERNALQIGLQYLTLKVLKTNKAAIALYKNFKYKEKFETDTIIEMEKSLNE